MVEKLYLNPSELYSKSFELAKQVIDSGFLPDFLIGLWRGGTPMAIAVHTYLESALDKKIEHFPLRISSYDDNIQGSIAMYPNELLESHLSKRTNLLIVDDVFDTGKTIETTLNYFAPKVNEVRSATLFYKATKNKTNIKPDYFALETDQWIIFPWDNFDEKNF